MKFPLKMKKANIDEEYLYGRLKVFLDDPDTKDRKELLTLGFKLLNVLEEPNRMITGLPGMNAGEIPATFSIDSEDTMPEKAQKFLKKNTNGEGSKKETEDIASES